MSLAGSTVARLRLITVPRRYLAGVVLGFALSATISTIQLWGEIVVEGGTDYGFYVAQAERWLSGSGFYEPRQLAGPYVAAGGIDNLYPPGALLLFLPFVWLPPVLWWAIPLGIIVLVIVSLRPSPRTWPVIAFLAWLPRSESIIIWGNTTMWLAAFVALGVRFGWPSILVLVKPSFAPFAMIGIRRRSWWLATGVLVTINVLLLPIWVQYARAWQNAGASWPGMGYSPLDYLAVAIPIVAWLGRSTPRSEYVTAPESAIELAVEAA